MLTVMLTVLMLVWKKDKPTEKMRVVHSGCLRERCLESKTAMMRVIETAMMKVAMMDVE